MRTGEGAVALFGADTWEGPAARGVLAEILWRFGQRDRAVADPRLRDALR